jgi:hypothetical protein
MERKTIWDELTNMINDNLQMQLIRGKEVRLEFLMLHLRKDSPKPT